MDVAGAGEVVGEDVVKDIRSVIGKWLAPAPSASTTNLLKLGSYSHIHPMHTQYHQASRGLIGTGSEGVLWHQSKSVHGLSGVPGKLYITLRPTVSAEGIDSSSADASNKTGAPKTASSKNQGSGKSKKGAGKDGGAGEGGEGQQWASDKGIMILQCTDPLAQPSTSSERTTASYGREATDAAASAADGGGWTAWKTLDSMKWPPIPVEVGEGTSTSGDEDGDGERGGGEGELVASFCVDFTWSLHRSVAPLVRLVFIPYLIAVAHKDKDEKEQGVPPPHQPHHRHTPSAPPMSPPSRTVRSTHHRRTTKSDRRLPPAFAILCRGFRQRTLGVDRPLLRHVRHHSNARPHGTRSLSGVGRARGGERDVRADVPGRGAPPPGAPAYE